VVELVHNFDMRYKRIALTFVDTKSTL
jgi:hypothetical protein